MKEKIIREFKVKDPRLLRYFLGIEVAWSWKGVVLSRKKYVLDRFNETSMMGCHPATTLKEYNHKICVDAGELVDNERYQRLVRWLIYFKYMLCVSMTSYTI